MIADIFMSRSAVSLAPIEPHNNLVTRSQANSITPFWYGVTHERLGHRKDILFQWRLNRKLEEARKHAARLCKQTNHYLHVNNNKKHEEQQMHDEEDICRNDFRKHLETSQVESEYHFKEDNHNGPLNLSDPQNPLTIDGTQHDNGKSHTCKNVSTYDQLIYEVCSLSPLSPSLPLFRLSPPLLPLSPSLSDCI
jgi:hypothetical protein